ncbi:MULTISPECIES: hypothetical protein [unclassified Mycobacterium]|uniref:hypothetical protein n=1 Tax=unclassified Mycobacterium TaxID=2642494 RepID=UPI0029C6D1CC|nr:MULTISPECIES: hypothetical protein [unclassified Mycobacterium]
MTETPEQTIEPTSESHAVTPRADESPRRWRKRDGHPRVYRVAAAVITVAATVFVIAVIFWSGFILGAHGGGGGHHGHGGGSAHGAAMMHHGHGGQGH